MPLVQKLRTWVLGSVAVFGLCVAALRGGEWGYAVSVSSFLAAGLAYDILSDRGYQLGSDAEGICGRRWGFRGLFGRYPEVRIVYDEISAIQLVVGGNAPRSPRAGFDLLELTSDPSADTILIDPDSFFDADIKPFLIELHDRRPEIFPDRALAYAESDRKY
jgi:hypothetical protein